MGSSPGGTRWRQGIPMDSREESGLLQHALQRAAHEQAWHAFGRGLSPVFEAGLAQNAVIALLGQNNTRSGGSVRGSQTRAYEMFVPGGLSEGGVLPPQNADSAWREALGADWFVKALRAGQRRGAKEGQRRGDRLAQFALTAPGASRAFVVHAPFLGSEAGSAAAPPDRYLPDYLEFFRAYKSAFVRWLETAAGGSARASRAKFSELLALTATPDGEDAFERAAEQVYGLPLSAASREEPSLEWEFLAWLARR